MKYFKVKYGYGKEEVLSIDDTELQRAMRAQAFGGVLVTRDGTISGRQIIAILPDWDECLYQLNKEITNAPSLEHVPPKIRTEYFALLKGVESMLGQVSTKPMLESGKA